MQTPSRPSEFGTGTLSGRFCYRAFPDKLNLIKWNVKIRRQVNCEIRFLQLEHLSSVFGDGSQYSNSVPIKMLCVCGSVGELLNYFAA